MHCEDLFINDSCDGQAIKAVGESFPKLDIVSSFALVIKPIDPVNRGTLMVPSKNEKVLGILDFVRQKQAYRL